MRAPLKYHKRGGLIALFGQPEPRDGYIGEFLAPVVEHREPIRTIHMRRSGNVVLLAIADGNGVSYWRVSNPDDPRRFTLQDLEAYVKATGDTVPILYLAQKYCADSSMRQREALVALASMAPQLQALLKAAGVEA